MNQNVHHLEGATATATTLEQAGPTVLVAVDGGPSSDGVVRAAHRIFGERATYLAINVGAGPHTAMSWSYVSPVGGLAMSYPPSLIDDLALDAATGVVDAQDEARRVAHDAGLEHVTPIGDVGDPASAIIRAAHHHGADVVVVGADERQWYRRLVAGSVERQLVRDADFAVLVVAPVDAP